MNPDVVIWIAGLVYVAGTIGWVWLTCRRDV